MLVVIDSNVWISAVVFGGNPRALLERVVQDGLLVVVSEEILTEVRRKLHQKFPDFLQGFEDVLQVVQRNVKPVKLGAISIQASRDPKDNMVLETAVIGRADFIVSGDKDLLVLNQCDNIPIVTPADFIKAINTA